MNELTARQEQVLRFLAKSEERGEYPTLREIGARFGIRSTNGVADHLRRLQHNGYLTLAEMVSRGTRLTDKARAYLGLVDPRTLALCEALDMLRKLGDAGFRVWLEDEVERVPGGNAARKARRSA